MQGDAPYYRRDLARIHHLGFGFHAEKTAPGILELLEPVGERAGLVVEIGCGSGLLTRLLLDAGYRVIATDASPAMLELARGVAGDAEEIRELVLPDDPIPPADAIVSVGHVLSYLPDAAAIDRALIAAAEALRPGGVLALDICDIEYAGARTELATSAGSVTTGPS
jgi:SAM-dependent methyltransferase